MSFIYKPSFGSGRFNAEAVQTRAWQTGFRVQSEMRDHRLIAQHWQLHSGNTSGWWTFTTPYPEALSLSAAAVDLAYILAGQVTLNVGFDYVTRSKSYTVNHAIPAPLRLVEALQSERTSPLPVLATNGVLSREALVYAEGIAVQLHFQAQQLLGLRGLFNERVDEALLLGVLTNLVGGWAKACRTLNRMADWESEVFPSLKQTPSRALYEEQRRSIHGEIQRHYPRFSGQDTRAATMLASRFMGSSPSLGEQGIKDRKAFMSGRFFEGSLLPLALLQAREPELLQKLIQGHNAARERGSHAVSTHELGEACQNHPAFSANSLKGVEEAALSVARKAVSAFEAGRYGMLFYLLHGAQAA